MGANPVKCVAEADLQYPADEVLEPPFPFRLGMMHGMHRARLFKAKSAEHDTHAYLAAIHCFQHNAMVVRSHAPPLEDRATALKQMAPRYNIDVYLLMTSNDYHKPVNQRPVAGKDLATHGVQAKLLRHMDQVKALGGKGLIYRAPRKDLVDLATVQADLAALQDHDVQVYVATPRGPEYHFWKPEEWPLIEDHGARPAFQLQFMPQEHRQAALDAYPEALLVFGGTPRPGDDGAAPINLRDHDQNAILKEIIQKHQGRTLLLEATNPEDECLMVLQAICEEQGLDLNEVLAKRPLTDSVSSTGFKEYFVRSRK